MRLEHRIVVGAEMSGDALPVDCCIKHAAHVDARDRTAMHAESDETARELVHHHEHPVAPKHDRFAAKEIDAPQAVCGMADERQPRWAGAVRRHLAIVF